MSRHILTDSELKYGYIKDDVFSGFSANHQFDGVTFHYLSGSVFSKTSHSQGDFHSHRTIENRTDGFVELFKELTSNVVDITVNEHNVIIIDEV
ncbi:MAG: hypothetical protein K2H28_05305 [Ruminococcus sp.]|nr:hypothetical protein [Ruminococcus sp.]